MRTFIGKIRTNDVVVGLVAPLRDYLTCWLVMKHRTGKKILDIKKSLRYYKNINTLTLKNI
jgi:hypothetical protein